MEMATAACPAIAWIKFGENTEMADQFSSVIRQKLVFDSVLVRM